MIFHLSLALLTLNSARETKQRTEGVKASALVTHPHWLLEKERRGGDARLHVPPLVRHAGGSVHTHRLKQINQTWPRITEKATDAPQLNVSASREAEFSRGVGARAEDYWKGPHMEICLHYTTPQMPRETLA